MDIFNIVSWLGLPLMAILVLGIARPNYRALAISTLLIAIPLSVLLASNNNHANVIRNFFMGMVMFSVRFYFMPGWFPSSSKST
jgi:hypothetical protein